MSFARRVVIDTGVLISAAIRPQSVPALATEKAFLQFEICVCDETLTELQTVLARPKFDRYVHPELRLEFFTGFRERVTRVPVTQIITDCIDPKDNVFLALAEATRAELIIASDPHRTNMHPWHEIPIIPPAAFLVGIQ